MSFHVGQKVVCVDARHTNADDVAELVVGAIYTIRWIGEHSGPSHWCGYWAPAICVRLEEVRRETDWGRLAFDIPFLASRFRPIQERKTDISVFTKLLAPKELERV